MSVLTHVCVTGEEDETVVFESRAKLFRLAGQEWKERGLGVMKILQHKSQPSKHRVLMRREQVHKVCANHAVHPSMILKPMGDKGNGQLTNHIALSFYRLMLASAPWVVVCYQHGYGRRRTTQRLSQPKKPSPSGLRLQRSPPNSRRHSTPPKTKHSSQRTPANCSRLALANHNRQTPANQSPLLPLAAVYQGHPLLV